MKIPRPISIPLCFLILLLTYPLLLLFVAGYYMVCSKKKFFSSPKENLTLDDKEFIHYLLVEPWKELWK